MNDPRSLLAQADKAAASAEGGFSLGSFFSGGGKTDKMEQAADLYTAAANSFKAQNMYIEAAKTFEKAAALQNKINEPDDAAMSLVEAFRCYDDGADPAMAVRVIGPAIQQFTIRGNFRRVADYKKDLGMLYQNKLGDNKAAVREYREAAERYKGNRAPSLASKMYLQCAEILAIDKEYMEAIHMFEEAVELLPDSVKRFQAAGYMLNAAICSLCNGDLIDTRKKLVEYEERGYLTKGMREQFLVQNLLQSVDEQNEEMFSDHLFNYNQVNTLDKWKTELLLRIKNTMQPAIHEETGEVDLS